MLDSTANLSFSAIAQRNLTTSDDIRCQWVKSVRNTLTAVWDQHRASVSTGDAWAIRALVKAEGPVRRKLNELNNEILKLEPQTEGA